MTMQINLIPNVKEEDVEVYHYTTLELAQLWSKAKQGKLTTREQLLLVNYAKFTKSWVEHIMDLLRQMVGKSSWTPKLQLLIDEFDYGTTDKNVIAAAKEYLKRHRE